MVDWVFIYKIKFSKINGGIYGHMVLIDVISLSNVQCIYFLIYADLREAKLNWINTLLKC